MSNSNIIKIINIVRNGKDVSPIGQHINILALNYLDDLNRVRHIDWKISFEEMKLEKYDPRNME